MDIEIRPVKPEDINYLIDVEIKCYEDVKGLDWWREILKNSDHYSVAAAVHKVPVGFIVWQKAAYSGDGTDEFVAEIERIAVKPAFRRRGAGSLLLRDATVAAHTVGLHKLMLIVPESLCFPGHPNDVSEWLLHRNFRATGILGQHFDSYGTKEDAFVFIGSGPS